MTNEQPRTAVLFDLDGTYADTAPDMIAALNVLRQQEGFADIPLEDARPYVSYGSKALVELGFPSHSQTDKQQLIGRFLAAYAENLAEQTRPFAGMQKWTQQMMAHGIAWGLVTNKPGYLTRSLLRQAPPEPAPMCVVTGDCLLMRKPHPMPVLHAAALLRTPAASCIYVGDARSDIVAGRAAGMYTVAAAYGYIPPNDSASSWHADVVVDSVQTLIDTINPLLCIDAQPPSNSRAAN